jgi:hypothetical protein
MLCLTSRLCLLSDFLYSSLPAEILCAFLMFQVHVTLT